MKFSNVVEVLTPLIMPTPIAPFVMGRGIFCSLEEDRSMKGGKIA